MDFQKLLLNVGQALSTDEIQALNFLCTDVVGQDLTSLSCASDLFSLLNNRDVLTEEQPYLLADLLNVIGRQRLMREFKLCDQISTTKSLISPYRILLYEVSEDVTIDELKQIKFLLKDYLPRKKLEEHITTLDLFAELERKDHLSNTNLYLLENICATVSPKLKNKIQMFIGENVTHTGHITQETLAGCLQFQSQSLSNMAPVQPPARSVSCGAPGFDEYSSGPSLQNSFEPCAPAYLNSSNNSIENTENGPEHMFTDEGLSQQVSRLTTTTSIDTAKVGGRPVFSKLASLASKTEKTTEDCNASEDVHDYSSSKINVWSNAVIAVLETYPMTGKCRGVCLIVNNYNFTSAGLKNRDGTHNDKKNLECVFKWLGFEIKTVDDCTSAQMLSAVMDLRIRDHSQMDCLVCCILSHGIEGCVYGVDGTAVPLRELMEPFTGLLCPSLVGKPKLFFIQACQGKKEQQAVAIETDSHTPGPVYSDDEGLSNCIPSDADFLMAMATVPRFVSYREIKGTWFIQTLCEKLVQMIPSGYHLLDILTKVNKDVSEKTYSINQKKQMPQPSFSLRKKVVFPTSEDPPPSLARDHRAQF